MTTSNCEAPDLPSLRDVDLDSVFAALSDPDRRYVLACLDDHSHSLTLRDLATRLAAWRKGVPVADVPAGAFESSYLSLHHRHVPRLVEADVVAYDPDRGTVRLREGADEPRVSVTLAKLDRRASVPSSIEG